MLSSNAAYRMRQLHLLIGCFLLACGPIRSLAQCTTPDPAIVSTAPFWTNFDVDGNTASDEFGILHYFTGSKIQAYASLVNVYTVGGDLVNVPDGQAFDGTEDISGSGEFLDLAPGNWQIIFRYIPDGRLGFLRFTVTDDGNSSSPDSIKIDQIGLQDAADTDGIVAGDCFSLENTVLPIELDFFRARTEQAHILLEWATVSEIDNLGFDVQRSTDGVHFYSIGWREGRGFSQERVSYSFVDEELQTNLTYYYRVVNRDRLGGGATSPVRSAQIQDDQFAAVSPAFPNPVMGDRTHIQIMGQRNTEVQWMVFNGQGQLVQQAYAAIDRGSNTLSIDVANLPVGPYIVLVEQEKTLARRQFLITR